jgi:hypothetical protein
MEQAAAAAPMPGAGTARAKADRPLMAIPARHAYLIPWVDVPTGRGAAAPGAAGHA